MREQWITYRNIENAVPFVGAAFFLRWYLFLFKNGHYFC